MKLIFIKKEILINKINEMESSEYKADILYPYDPEL